MYYIFHWNIGAVATSRILFCCKNSYLRKNQKSIQQEGKPLYDVLNLAFTFQFMFLI